MYAAVANQATLIAISEAERVEITFPSDRDMERAIVQYVSGDMFETFRLHAATGRLLSPKRRPAAWCSSGCGHIERLLVATFWTRSTSDRANVPATMHWGISFPEWSLFRVFVHLQPGVSTSAVRDHLSATLRAFNESKANRVKQALEMDSASAGVSAMQKNYRVSLVALGLLVILVLLIACANGANLMTAQAAARSREMSIRVSIGARRWRLAQLVLVEAAIIGLFASVFGWCFAQWSAPLVLASVNPPNNPARLSLSMDWRVPAFAFALTLCVTLFLGIEPALRAYATKPMDALRRGDAPRSRARWMRTLIAVQAAFCFVVLLVAGLLVATFDRLHGQSNGLSSERILNVDIVNPANEPSTQWDQVADLLRRIRLGS